MRKISWQIYIEIIKLEKERESDWRYKIFNWFYNMSLNYIIVF